MNVFILQNETLIRYIAFVRFCWTPKGRWRFKGFVVLNGVKDLFAAKKYGE